MNITKIMDNLNTVIQNCQKLYLEEFKQSYIRWLKDTNFFSCFKENYNKIYDFKLQQKNTYGIGLDFSSPLLFIISTCDVINQDRISWVSFFHDFLPLENLLKYFSNTKMTLCLFDDYLRMLEKTYGETDNVIVLKNTIEHIKDNYGDE